VTSGRNNNARDSDSGRGVCAKDAIEARHTGDVRMTVDNRVIGRLLAEVLRLQRWAGGDSVSAARVFGLMHGFESALEEDQKSGITRVTQDKVEDLLEDVDAGKQSVSSRAIKDRLRKAGVSESDAKLVMQLCRLQGRFADTVEKIAKESGSRFRPLLRWKAEERDWHGALHYLELFDSTEGARKKLHAAFSPCIPRVGDIIKPERGSRMKVVAVEHVAISQTKKETGAVVLLIPYVMLKAIRE
jgi:hypothetical protein